MKGDASPQATTLGQQWSLFLRMSSGKDTLDCLSLRGFLTWGQAGAAQPMILGVEEGGAREMLNSQRYPQSPAPIKGSAYFPWLPNL